MYQLANLARLKNVRCILLSVGGNDLLLNPAFQMELAKSALPFQSYRRTALAQQFRQRYEAILDLIRMAAPRALIVPIICYHPHYQFSLLGVTRGITGAMALQLQKWYLAFLVTPLIQQVIALCHERGFPIIDLSRTFDPSNAAHFGTGEIKTRTPFCAWSGCEPSNISSQFIAELAIYVMKNHNLDGASYLYRGNTNATGLALRSIVRDENSSSYAQHYTFSVGPPKSSGWKS